MAEELTNDGNQAQTSEGSQQQSSSDGFVTADALNSALQDMQNSMFANMRRMVEGIAKQSGSSSRPEPKQQPKEGAGVDDVRAMLASRDAFHDALLEYPGLSKAQIKKIRAQFDAESPADVGTWVDEWAGVFGVAKGQSTNNQPKADGVNAKAPPNPNPMSDGGAPAGKQGLESGDPTWEMSQDDVDRLIREKGFIKAGQILRDKLGRDMRGRRFYIGRQQR